jgi:DNA-binding response OmpR family regulator
MPMSAKKALVLIVDDDTRMRRMMQRMLEIEDYWVITAATGEQALNLLDNETPDIILLDIMMPGMNGIDVCQRIRQFSSIPIIMVTAKGDDSQKVIGLDSGADDYVTKPFSTDELVARVRAVLRRQTTMLAQMEPRFSAGELFIDFLRRRVKLGKKEVNLTATEYRLLGYLAQNAGRVLTPDQLLEKVWGEEYIGENHILQVNIARLRQKLGDSATNPHYIRTRPGIGYMMVQDE